MKILYDSQIFESQKYGGVSRYFVELMSAYTSDKKVDVVLSTKISDNEYLLKSSLYKNQIFSTKYLIRMRSRISHIVNYTFLRYKFITNDIDIFHPTNYDTSFLKYIGSTPFVLTIYDMIHEKFPEMFLASNLTTKNKKILAERSAKIIAISHSTKQDIVEILGIKPSKIEVIYLGNSMLPSVNSDCMSLKDIPSKYILFVGSRHKYKNFNRFISSITPLLVNEPDLFIVCAGGGKFTSEERSFFIGQGVLFQIMQYSISDELLARIYENAILFVFPSMYEGFGIPILEAFSCKCPVVCSQTSSLPEVAGDAAIYFDPYDNGSIFNAVLMLLENSNLREELVKKGTERLKQFSWTKNAQETKKLYKSIL